MRTDNSVRVTEIFHAVYLSPNLILPYFYHRDNFRCKLQIRENSLTWRHYFPMARTQASGLWPLAC